MSTLGRRERRPAVGASHDPLGVLTAFTRKAHQGTDIDELAGEALDAATAIYEVPCAMLLEVRDGELVPLASRGWPGPVRAELVDQAVPDAGVMFSSRLAAAAGLEPRSKAATALTVRGRLWALLAVFEAAGKRASAPAGPGLEVIAHVLATAEEARHAHHDLEEIHLHDPLTGLPNLPLLVDRLEHAILRRRPERMLIAVLSIDIDRFEMITVRFGHYAGDGVIDEVASRLRRAVRLQDTLARYGGARFVVLSAGLPAEAELRAEAERLQAAAGGPFRIGDRDLIVSVSVGTATAHSDTTSEDLLHDAVSAVQRAKAEGGSRIVAHDHRFDRDSLKGRELESDLRRALVEQQFLVHYQPIVRLEDGHLLGAEALARWNHPARGIVAPSEFIALAEDTGLIIPLGEWVVTTACRHAQQWGEQAASRGAPAPGISVNLSGRQINELHLVDRIQAALAASHLPPSLLTLEITESVVMADAEAAVKVLGQLKDLGVNLSIDDFGTGYSSLSYLKRFPVDTLKIDRSFVSGLGTDPDDGVIVGAIIGLAAGLGVETIAEGVETKQQLNELLRLGCTQAQGYYFARPEPYAAITARLGFEPTALS